MSHSSLPSSAVQRHIPQVCITRLSFPAENCIVTSSIGELNFLVAFGSFLRNNSSCNKACIKSSDWLFATWQLIEATDCAVDDSDDANAVDGLLDSNVSH